MTPDARAFAHGELYPLHSNRVIVIRVQEAAERSCCCAAIAQQAGGSSSHAEKQEALTGSFREACHHDSYVPTFAHLYSCIVRTAAHIPSRLLFLSTVSAEFVRNWVPSKQTNSTATPAWIENTVHISSMSLTQKYLYFCSIPHHRAHMGPAPL